MNKTYLLGILTFVIMLIVPSCDLFFGTTPTPTPTLPPVSTPAPTAKIIELDLINSINMEDTGQAAAWYSILDAFEAANPGIKLNVENHTQWDEYDQYLQAYDLSNHLPDIISYENSGYFPVLMKKGSIVDLYPYLGAEINNFHPAAVVPHYNGKLFSLPANMIASHVLYTNTQLLDDLGLNMPQSYAELVAMKNTITNAGLIPILIGYQEGWIRQSCLFSTIMGRVAGVAWFNNALAGSAGFNDVQFIDALDLLKNMFDTGLIPAGSLNISYFSAIQQFMNGEGVFLINGDWVTADLRQMPQQLQEKIVMSVLPDIPGQVSPSGATAILSTGFAMKAGLTAEKAAAAWKWIHFYAGPQAALLRVKYTDTVPAYQVDLSNVYMDTMRRKKIEFHTNRPALTIIDSIIRGYQLGILQNGLLDLATNTRSSAQVAAEFEAVMQQWR